MKKIGYILLILSMSLWACGKNIRNVTVLVSAENGLPIEGANVHVGYIGQTAVNSSRIKGKSNKLGMFLSSGRAPLRMKVMIDKKGYYPSVVKSLSKQQDHDLEVILRKKKKPISLYAKKYRGKVPKINEACGFDLEISDWVKPYGKGKIKDLIFTVKIIKDAEDKLGGKLEITFPYEVEGYSEINSQTGFLSRSELTMPNLAPLVEYQTKLTRTEWGYENKSKPLATSYFFRTRFSENKEEVSSYNYSKFSEGINFNMGGGQFIEEPYRSKYPNEYGFVEFIYYFNPIANDRNLEFDTHNNLFKNLDSTEKVNKP